VLWFFWVHGSRLGWAFFWLVLLVGWCQLVMLWLLAGQSAVMITFRVGWLLNTHGPSQGVEHHSSLLGACYGHGKCKQLDPVSAACCCFGSGQINRDASSWRSCRVEFSIFVSAVLVVQEQTFV